MTEFINNYQQIKKSSKYLHSDLLNTWSEYSHISSFIIKKIHEIFNEVFNSDIIIGDLSVDINRSNVYIKTSYPINIELLDKLKDFLGVDAKIEAIGSKKSARIQITFASDI